MLPVALRQTTAPVVVSSPYTEPSSDPTNTRLPSDEATGDEITWSSVACRQISAPVEPSIEYTVPSHDPNVTADWCTSGDERTAPAVMNDQSKEPSATANA